VQLRRSCGVGYLPSRKTSATIALSGRGYLRLHAAHKKERQATLAITCLYLNLSHLLKGGQVRGQSIRLAHDFGNILTGSFWVTF